jgi:hypothetical protein
MDADSELIVSWLVAGRDAESAYASFANELADQIVSLDWLLSAVSANRWLRFTSETPLLDSALEKYDPVSAPALPFRQTRDVCPCDIRAFWAVKLTFQAERHREREKAFKACT